MLPSSSNLFVLPSSSNDCVVSGPGCNIICLCCLLPPMIVLCLVQGVILSVCVAFFPNDCVVSGSGCNIICLCCLLPLMIVLCLWSRV